MIPSNTVKELILRLLDDFGREYTENVNRFSRWKHRKDPFQVFLSPNLFQRLFKEESMKPDKVRAVCVGSTDYLVMFNQTHPEINMDFVISLGGYPIGYNPQFYGLKE